MSLPSYEYRPLDSPSSIRIFILQPSEDFSAPVEGSIIHRDRRALLRDFESVEHYEAVSYFWGDPDFSCALFCDGRSSVMGITPNVNSLLRYLRKTSKPRYLWVDAICVNQKDNKERGHQVQLMGEIYRQAKKVHVWLGEADEDVPKILVFLRALAGIGEKDISPALAEKELMLTSNSDAKQSIIQFLARPWFERRWVVQEVALSHHTTIRCGQLKMARYWFTEGLKVLKRATELGFLLCPKSIHTLENVAAFQTNTGEILDILWRFHYTRCKDPKDKLFALYGLAQDITTQREEDTFFDSFFAEMGVSSLVRPIYSVINYDGHWQDTYCQFARDCIEAGYGNTILRHLAAFGSLAEQDP
ncbi:HET-domain-containing protein, partial [Glonium stellatum]